MAISKVQVKRNGVIETLIDLTSDTVTAETLAEGVTGHDAQGEQIVGKLKTTPKLQDKTITENGTYQADSGYDGLGSVTVEVASGGSLEGLENGYDVMFYDENNDGLAFYSIKQGHTINPPVYNCKAWQTADGQKQEFPFTPTEDVIFYANNDTLASQLYEFYDVDPATHPHILITHSTQSTSPYLRIVFGTMSTNGSGSVGGLGGQSYQRDLTDHSPENIVKVVMEKIKISENYSDSLGNQSWNYNYTNFDPSISKYNTGNSTCYRID